ncbi:MAG TPA: alpha/beta hydrolase [Streptosporangiaceae bacterium]
MTTETVYRKVIVRELRRGAEVMDRPLTGTGHRPGSQGGAAGRGPPPMLETDANPEGLPIEVFDGLRDGVAKDRSQFYKNLAFPFYGANRPGAQVSRGILDQFWVWSMQDGIEGAYESIKAFSETDFTDDLRAMDIPTLVMHGEDDQIVPVDEAGRKSARILKDAREIYYPGRRPMRPQRDRQPQASPGVGRDLHRLDVWLAQRVVHEPHSGIHADHQREQHPGDKAISRGGRGG